MPGPAPKPADRRQRRNTDTGRAAPSPTKPVRVHRPGESVLPAGDETADIPDPSDTWPEWLVEEWSAAWRTLGAAWHAPSDIGACRRLFDYRARLAELEDRDPVTEGSQGQLVASPWLKAAQELRSEVRQLEDRFGLTPMARLRLGITLGEAHASLSGLSEALDREMAASTGFDPRTLLEGEVIE